MIITSARIARTVRQQGRGGSSTETALIPDRLGTRQLTAGKKAPLYIQTSCSWLSWRTTRRTRQSQGRLVGLWDLGQSGISAVSRMCSEDACKRLEELTCCKYLAASSTSFSKVQDDHKANGPRPNTKRLENQVTCMNRGLAASYRQWRRSLGVTATR